MTRGGRARGVGAALAGALLLTALPATAGNAADGDPAAGSGAVSGVVRDDQGGPLEGIDVWAGCYGAGGTSVYEQTAETETAADGTYTFGNLVAGPCDFSFYELQGRLAPEDRWEVPIMAGTTTQLDVVMAAYGFVTGTMVGDDGAPVTGGSVHALAVGRRWSYGGNVSGTGEYTLRVPPGPYRIQFSGSGMASEYFDDVATLEDAQVLTVAAGQTISGIDAVLGAGRVISGVVTSSDGTPVAGLEVSANAAWGEGTSRRTNTAADGTYRLTGLSAVPYTVKVSPTGAQLWLPTTYPATVPVGATQETTDVDVVVELGGRIEGTVTGPDGSEIRGRAQAVDGGANGPLDVFSDGQYSILVAPGDHILEFVADGYAREFYDDVATKDAATPVRVAAGEVLTGIDAVLDSGQSLTGRLTDATGAPAAGVVVDAFGNGMVRTDVDGRYALGGLMPGTVTRVTVEDRDGLRFLPQTFIIDVGATPTLDVTLQRGGVISGHVTDALGGSPDGAVFTNGGGESTFVWHANDPGAYSLVVRPGTHTVGFRATGYLDEYYDDVESSADATQVTVAEGQTVTGIDAVLERGVSIIGTVRDSRGTPIPGLRFHASRGMVGNSWCDQWYDGVTATDGSYAVEDLRPGQPYYVLVCDPSGRYAYTGAYVTTPTEGSVRADVTVRVGGTVSGRVTGPMGEPVAGAAVTVQSGSVPVSATTRADGTYSVAGVTPGANRVEVVPQYGSQYDSQIYDWQANGSRAFGAGGAGTPVTVNEGSAVAGLDMQLWYRDLAHVFYDVPASHPFVREISWMKANGISTGNANGTYGPTASVTREAMAAFLYRMAGRPAYTAPTTSPFRDVARSHPFYKEICWLASTGITTGWSDGTFRPGTAVERQAMAAFLYRFAGKPAFTAPATSPFWDVRPTDPFYKEIAWLASVRVAGGYSDGGYHPTATVDRQAMAAFLNRLDRYVLD